MVTIGLILLGAAWVALIVAFKLVALGIVALVLLLFLFLVLRGCMFRPQENHVVAIYRFGRLSRLVGPEKWTYLIPGVDVVRKQISLDPHRVEISLSDLWTKDRIPINCELVVFYQVDVRRAREDFRPQALRIPNEGWNSIVKTVLQEVTAGAVGFQTLDQLISPDGRADLKQALSMLLANRLKGLGMVVNPQRGVSVGALQPADTIRRAIEELGAAGALGEAAGARLRPTLDELSRQGLGIGLDVLLLELAAAVVKDGAVTQALGVSERAAVLAALLEGGGRHVPINQSANGKAAPNGDGRYQMELPLGLE